MAGFQLILAEKPSVARDVARVLGLRGGGKGVIGRGTRRVSWFLGHLVELAEPGRYQDSWKSWRLEDLPMLPERFRLQPRKDGRDQWSVVKALLRDSELQEVVNACDAGREGELIFAYAYELCGCRAPVRRLWISSMTDSAIRTGFQQLRPGARMKPLEDAARCRSEADWLVGLNATRAMTLRLSRGPGSPLWSLGRVQTPTLALLDAREAEIERFQPRDFWQLRVRFAVEEPQPGSWEAVWVRTGSTDAEEEPNGEPGGESGDRDRFFERQQAEEVLRRVEGLPGEVIAAERRRRRERHPLLYDLTSLQREANKRFGFSAKRSLDLAQALYERHKLLTYPRTDSRHLSEDQRPGLPDILRGLEFGPYAQAAQVAQQRPISSLGKRVIDDSEVSDHHAIVPTGLDPRGCSLQLDEKRIYDLVARRFLAVFFDDAVFAVVKLDTAIGRDCFRARGRSCLDPGWQVVDPPFSKRKELLLPAVEVGQVAQQLEARLHQGRTRPPKRYNEAALLGAMERAGEVLEEVELKRAMKRNGLGTPATRAAIIETLLRRGYVERRAAGRNRQVVPTERGRALLRALPVEALRSPRLTGQWEARLVAMAEGQEARERFMADIRGFTGELVAALRQAPLSVELEGALAGVSVPDGEPLGPCPRCQAQVVEARGGWRCQGCVLFIPGSVARRPVSRRMAGQLLKKGQSAVVKGFRSKQGKKFSAALRLDEGGRVRLHFPEPEALGDCPACDRPVRARGRIYTCESGRECPFVVYEEMSGRALPEEAVRQLLSQGRSALLDGFRTRDGQDFAGVLTWTGQRVQVVRTDARQEQGPAGACPRCGQAVSFTRGAWRCAGCALRIPGSVARRALGLVEVGDLLARGRSARLHGFRQKSGTVFKASLVLDEQGHVRLDYKRRDGDVDEPLPAGAPPPAFGRRMACPACAELFDGQPGYVVAGRTAWGCSRWRQGCALQVPFVIEQRRLSDEEAQRLFSRQRATKYARGFVGPAGVRSQARVVLDLQADPCWRVQQRRPPKRRR